MIFLKFSIIVFEYLLYSVLGIFTLLGYCDGLFANIPTINQINGLPLLIIFGICAFSISIKSETKLTNSSSFGISILTLTLIRMSLISGSQLYTIFNSPLLFIVIIGAGVFGTSYCWVIPFFIFIIGDLFFTLSTFTFTNHIQLLINIKDIFLSNIISYTYLLTIGIFSSISHLKLITNKSDIKSTNSLDIFSNNQDKINSSETTLVQNSSPQQNTQQFTIEYTSGLSQNQAENIQEILSSVVYFMSRNFKSYSSLGFIFDPLTQMFILNSYHSKSLNIVKGVQIPLGTGVVGRIGTEKRSFMSGNYSFYSPELLYYHGSEEINSIIAVPVISENNELLGTLVIDSTDKNTFKEQDKEILKRFSSLAAALITNTRIRIYQERAAHTFKIFYETSHMFTTALNSEDVFDVLFQIIPMITICTRQIAIVFNEDEKIGMVYRINGTKMDIPTGFKFAVNNGLYSFVLKKRKLVNVADYSHYDNKYFRFVPEEAKDPNIRSLIIFPIIDDGSRCRGLFSIESDQPNQYHEEIQQILTTLIENASVAFTRALLYKKMEKLATTDGLTELNNHRQFQELLSQELERSQRYNRTVSLLLMDIDHFKTFNDTYGHPVGDLVLKEISKCIRLSIRSNDIAARYGGEEFAVILPETLNKGGIIIAERIRSTIEKHIIHSLDRQLKVTISIGCASSNASQIDQKELINRADQALYHSKEHGRNRVTLFSETLSKSNKIK